MSHRVQVLFVSRVHYDGQVLRAQVSNFTDLPERVNAAVRKHGSQIFLTTYVAQVWSGKKGALVRLVSVGAARSKPLAQIWRTNNDRILTDEEISFGWDLWLGGLIRNQGEDLLQKGGEQVTGHDPGEEATPYEVGVDD